MARQDKDLKNECLRAAQASFASRKKSFTPLQLIKAYETIWRAVSQESSASGVFVVVEGKTPTADLRVN